jgi:signal transduction histidine kinase
MRFVGVASHSGGSKAAFGANASSVEIDLLRAAADELSAEAGPQALVEQVVGLLARHPPIAAAAVLRAGTSGELRLAGSCGLGTTLAAYLATIGWDELTSLVRQEGPNTIALPGEPRETALRWARAEPLRHAGRPLGALLVVGRDLDPARAGTGAAWSALASVVSLALHAALARTQSAETAQGPSSNALAKLALLNRFASLGKLGGGLVHEVNNPSTFVALASAQIDKVVERALGAPSPEALEPARQFAREIGQSIKQIRDVVADYHLLTAMSPGSVVGSIELVRMLQAAVSLTIIGHRTRARVTTRFEALPTCPSDFVRLAPVVVDLLLNAIEAVPADDRPHEIGVLASASEPSFVLEVVDTGHGIAPEVLPRVFDAFFTTRSEPEHAGLGLTLARDTAEHLGGEVRIASRVGRGTEVRVTVPMGGGSMAASG